MKALGYATAIWTNNDRVVADFVLSRFGLLPHLDLVVTRDDVRHLKPDPDGLRVVRERWPDAPAHRGRGRLLGGRRSPRRRAASRSSPTGRASTSWPDGA